MGGLSWLWALVAASPSAYQVLYTGGSADKSVKLHGHYEVVSATYSASGKLLETHNLTKTDAFLMGYPALSPGGEVVFAMQRGHTEDVGLFKVLANATEAPVEQIHVSSLLALCTDCIQPATMDSFSATFGPNGEMVFGFRLWDGFGHGQGNQGLALLDGGKVTSLTYGRSMDPNLLDTCPRFVAPGVIVFLRLADGGKPTLMVMDLASGQAQPVATAAIYEDFPSCPEKWGDDLILFTGAMTFSKALLVRGTLDGKQLVRVESLVPDPTVQTSIASGVLEFMQCQPVGDRLACLTAEQLIAVMPPVSKSADPTTWTNFSLPHGGPNNPGWCFTDTCFVVRETEANDAILV